jgi:predicted MPP superfamily phosphohydrolase
MNRLCWLTDLHFNFVGPEQVAELLEQVRSLQADGVVITGDIGEATDVVEYLAQIDEALGCPVYFVLGNHDFYFGSIDDVRRRVRELCGNRPQLHYLTSCERPLRLGHWRIVGHDGWADARIGDYERSMVMMNDYRLIDELAPCNKQQRLPLLRQLGDEAAEHVRGQLQQALQPPGDEPILLVTHVPPFHEACWHQGQLSDDEWAPHFTCQAMGDMILQMMSQHDDRRLLALCGHTHGEGQCRMRPNVRVLTGGAEYGSPAVAGVLENVEDEP